MKRTILLFSVALLFSACVVSPKNSGTNSQAVSRISNGTSASNSTSNSLLASLGGANNADVVVQKVDKDDVRDIIRQEKMLAFDNSESELTFAAVGEGIAPMNTVSSAQALALAKRAAITDAYRQLASKLYGVKINGKDTVKDAMLGSSTITSQVNGLIKNASVIDESFNQGLYRVNVELKIDESKWKELFSY